jgi:hypothetical protein
VTESIKWSFSADRCARRCQRQFFLQHKAAWHTTRDRVRREAFLLKQVKTLELWQGSLVHRAIELHVVPALKENRAVDWGFVADQAVELAARQFAFSAARRYREDGITKTSAGDDYRALAGHESPNGVPDERYRGVIETVREALTNLSELDEFWSEVRGRRDYWSELEVRVDYDIAHIEAHIDLMFFRGFGKPTIVDWKISESDGGGDADLQTAFYAWTLCQHPKWSVSSAEDCELLEVQLLRKTVLRHQADQATFDRLENRIYRSVDAMRAMGFANKYDLSNLGNFDFAENPNNCAYCPVQSLCQRLVSEGPEMSKQSGPKPPARKRKPKNEPAYPQLF